MEHSCSLPEVALPFSTHKVQGVGFRVVLCILFFVHETPKNDELSSALYHSVKAGLRRSRDRSRSPVTVNLPGHDRTGFGPGHVQHVHLHGLTVKRLVQGLPYIQALRWVMAQAPCYRRDSMSVSYSSLWGAGGG